MEKATKEEIAALVDKFANTLPEGDAEIFRRWIAEENFAAIRGHFPTFFTSDQVAADLIVEQQAEPNKGE